MKLSVCVDAVFMGKAIEEAVQKVKEAGLDTIEFWTWEDKDVELLEKLHGEGINIAAFCTGFISLVEKGERDKYIESLKKTIATAKRLGCSVLISQTGPELSVSRQQQHESMVEGLKACVPYLFVRGDRHALYPGLIGQDLFRQGADHHVDGGDVDVHKGVGHQVAAELGP